MNRLIVLRKLCAELWNPIGVPMANLTSLEKLGFPPLPADEYDGYLSKFAQMIEDGASRADLVAFLDKVEREYLMLSRPAGNKEAFVHAALKEIAPGKAG